MSEADEPAATSDVEQPDKDSDGSDDEEKKPVEPKPKKAKTKPAAKGKGKGRGGVTVPEEWPWEEAKKIFEKPDVLPADEVEVSIVLGVPQNDDKLILFEHIARMEQPRCGRSGPVPGYRERLQVCNAYS